uniref:DYW domain-containing protein n=1 Tax=Manihot esculenta TaxID=3983 RepID=A0A2C9W251_MANES
MVPDAGVWGTLLNSCKIHGTVEFGELALEKLIELDPSDGGNREILSNIYAQPGKLEGRMEDAEYVPNTGSVFHDVEDEKTGMILGSQRKKLKICENCHVAVKLISKITEREIIVRDVNLYHHFSDEICTCGDYL